MARDPEAPVPTPIIERIRVLQARLDTRSHGESAVVGAETARLELAVLLIYGVELPEEIALGMGILDQLVARQPGDIDAMYWLARSLLEFGSSTRDGARAGRIVEEALRAAPERPDCLTLYARIREGQEAPLEEREDLLRRALKLTPEWIAPRYELARTLIQMRNLRSAEEEVMKAISYFGRGVRPDILYGHRPMETLFERLVTGRARLEYPEDFTQLLGEIRDLGHSE